MHQVCRAQCNKSRYTIVWVYSKISNGLVEKLEICRCGRDYSVYCDKNTLEFSTKTNEKLQGANTGHHSNCMCTDQLCQNMKTSYTTEHNNNIKHLWVQKDSKCECTVNGATAVELKCTNNNEVTISLTDNRHKFITTYYNSTDYQSTMTKICNHQCNTTSITIVYTNNANYNLKGLQNGRVEICRCNDSGISVFYYISGGKVIFEHWGKEWVSVNFVSYNPRTT